MIEEHQLVPFTTKDLPVDEGPWLVLAPHADDESFGMGGTIAKAADAGISTHLWVLTDGALGGSAVDLVAQRQREAHVAAKVLGMESVQFHHEPDRHLKAHPALMERLTIAIGNIRPAAVFFPGVHEFHPDHRACALIAWRLLQDMGDAAPLALSYEISAQSPANCLIDISSTIPQKLQALNAYDSQLAQNNYADVVMALNKLRTFTLASHVQWAEAFYRFSKDELRLTLGAWAASRATRMLTPDTY
jgi:LmbE family N-acetylglucosaminyl deacetylase